VTATAAAALLALAGDAAGSGDARSGGTFVVSLQGLDFIDPALSYTPQGWALLDTTCARLMTHPDKPPPEGFRLVPEVAAGYPKISRDSKTYTFTLRDGFRFSDGTRVRASAFARAINRTLMPDIRSTAAQYTRDIAGAADVQSGKAQAAPGVIARGNTLVVRFTRPVLDFAAKTTSTAFCAVPPTLPSDPEGIGRPFPAAGPYYVAEYRPGERVLLRRNRFYGGTRPHHVDGFDVDLRATSPQEVLDRVERNEADWGYVSGTLYFEPGRNLAAKYGLSRFFVRPGHSMSYIAINSSRPLFRNNPKLRRAVNYAISRRAVGNAAGGPLGRELSDQYLPPGLPGFKDAEIYRFEGGDLARARELARGNTRDGKVALYVTDFPQPRAVGQVVKQALEAIGLDVQVTLLPFHAASSAYLGRLGDPNEPWDLAPVIWTPDFIDPYGYINLLLDSQFVGGTNLSRFESSKFDRLMRRAARLQGAERYRAYGLLDVQLARDAAPLISTGVFNEATLVSSRVGCIVLRPTLDLTATCLESAR
jgi:peptide/nickel transport system substrate-binding protein